MTPRRWSVTRPVSPSDPSSVVIVTVEAMRLASASDQRDFREAGLLPMRTVDALDAMKKPTILVIQQKWPPELMNKAGLAGEMMISSMMAVGCVGMLSNGPSRDVDAIRKLNFQLLLGGVTAGHGEMAVQSVNVPVSVGGMDVAPGDLIHMDENGAVKFPPQHAAAVVKNARAMLDDEAARLVLLRKARTAAEVRAASSGGAYTPKKG